MCVLLLCEAKPAFGPSHAHPPRMPEPSPPPPPPPLPPSSAAFSRMSSISDRMLGVRATICGGRKSSMERLVTRSELTLRMLGRKEKATRQTKAPMKAGTKVSRNVWKESLQSRERSRGWDRAICALVSEHDNVRTLVVLNGRHPTGR